MEAQVKKWGNSLGIRIPRALADDIGIKEDSFVDLHSEAGTLVIHPRTKVYKLEDLLAKVTKDNVHSVTEWGERMGKELW